MNDALIRSGKRGAALITVMFIFSITAVIVMALAFRERIDIRRTQNLLAQAQAFEYALAAEELARQVLAADDVTVTYPAQHWAKTQEIFPVGQGTVSLAIEDLQGKFNINTLLNNNVAPAYYFGQLLARQGMPVSLAPAVAAQLETMSRNGMLQGVYSPDILRSISGFDPENYEAIAPYITVLPESMTTLNVNTAPDLLLHLHIPDDKILDRLNRIRSVNGFVTEKQLRAIGMNTAGLGVVSCYFGVYSQAQSGGITVHLTSVLRRDKDASGTISFHIISRDLSNPL